MCKRSRKVVIKAHRRVRRRCRFAFNKPSARKTNDHEEEEQNKPQTEAGESYVRWTYFAKAQQRKDPAAVALGRKGGLKGGYARAASMTAAAAHRPAAESGKSAVAKKR